MMKGTAFCIFVAGVFLALGFALAPSGHTASAQPQPTATTITGTATIEVTATSAATGVIEPTSSTTPVATIVATTEPTAAPQPPAAAATGSISAGNQSITNNTLVIDSATISQNGWIAVHESNADGTGPLVPQSVVQVPLSAGTSANIAIDLGRRFDTGTRLWPMLHIDTGQIGVYEFPAADPPVVEGGMPVMVPVVIANEEAVVLVGMPSTGALDLLPFVITGMLVGLGLLGFGLFARRRAIAGR